MKPLLVPQRYAETFSRIQMPSGPWAWRCRRCGQVIRPNTAGAQSHVVRHVRERQDAAPELAKLLRYPAKGGAR